MHAPRTTAPGRCSAGPRVAPTAGRTLLVATALVPRRRPAATGAMWLRVASSARLGLEQRRSNGGCRRSGSGKSKTRQRHASRLGTAATALASGLRISGGHRSSSSSGNQHRNRRQGTPPAKNGPPVKHALLPQRGSRHGTAATPRASAWAPPHGGASRSSSSSSSSRASRGSRRWPTPRAPTAKTRTPQHAASNAAYGVVRRRQRRVRGGSR